MAERRRRTCTPQFKLRAIQLVPNTSNSVVARHFQIPPSCISRWVRSAEKIRQQPNGEYHGPKRGPPVRNPELEDRLMTWLWDARRQRIRPTCAEIQRWAILWNRESDSPIPDFKASRRFVEKLLIRFERQLPDHANEE